jgi:hypothetical protein
VAEPDREPSAGALTAGPWDVNGTASLIASGNDRRAVIEAGLRAVLNLVAPTTPAAPGASRAVPVRGSGADLSALFADIAADLLAQIEALGARPTDVTVDGVVQGEAGHSVAWGYVFGPLDSSAIDNVPVLIKAVEVSTACAETGDLIELRVRLRRG